MFKRHPYIQTIILTTIVSLVAWGFVPKRYAAQTKLVDEYKEVDLAIGMNSMSAAIRDAMQKSNEGINDIEVYCKMLATEDFARELSHKLVSGKGKSYGEYLADKDTIETILDNLNYNLSTRQQAVTIQMEDRDPLVAAQMLDSITAMLQEAVTTRRHDMAMSLLHNAETELQESKHAYLKAQDAYAAYRDSHAGLTLEKEKTEATQLRKNAELSFKRYQDATEQYTRQKSLAARSYCSFAVSKTNRVPVEDKHHPYGYTLFTVVLALILVKGYRLLREHKSNHWKFDFGNIFSPWALTIGIWCIDLALCFLQKDMLYPIQPLFWKCLAIWLPLFCTASFFSCSFAQKGKALEEDTGMKVNMMMFNILWCISMILSPLYLYKVLGVVTQFDTENLLYNIRILAVSGESGSLILNSVQAINIALFISAIWLYPKVSKIRIVTIIVAYLVVEFAMMEKSGILIMILSTLFVLYQKKVIHVRTIAVIMTCTILLFFFINMSKEEKDQDSATFLDFFGMYVTTPAVAFSYLHQSIQSQFGLNTFSQVFQYSNLLGFNFEYVDRLQDFMLVPIPTNVYTIFQPFYEDFGITGVAFFAVFYGTFFGWIYGKHRSGNFYCRLLYTYAVEIVIIQFYNENMLQNLFQSVGFTFWTFLLAQQTFMLTKCAYR